MIKKKEDDKEQWFIYRANLRTKTLVIIGLAALIIISIFVILSELTGWEETCCSEQLQGLD